MKLILILLYLTIHIAGTLWAQEENHVFHYPLNIGDVWEYRRSPGFLVTREVIGDTMLANGKTYRVLKEVAPEGTSTFFQRVSDSSEVFQFNQLKPNEFLRFKLDIKKGDSWTFKLFGSPSDSAFSEVFQLADTTVFSSKFKFAQIESFTLPDSLPLGFGRICILVDSIGIFFEGFEAGRDELQGAIIDGRQFGVITSVHPVEDGLIEKNDSFFNNYPNPFNNSTTIEYRLSQSARVRISIFNVLGERVRLLTDSFQTPGMQRVNWFGNNESGRLVSSGIYFYAIKINGTVTTRKSILFLK